MGFVLRLAIPNWDSSSEEELEAVDYHRYDGKYGRVLLAYQILEDELLLLVTVQISLRIQRISMQSP